MSIKDIDLLRYIFCCHKLILHLNPNETFEATFTTE